MSQTASPQRCRCGHDRDAHEHYRQGSECGICGAQECPRFRPAGGLLARLRARLG